MTTIRQHRPAFVDLPAPKAEFATVEELLEIPWVARWTDIGFCNFRQSIHPDQTLLMVSRDDGSEWWVVGELSEPVDLPRWTPPEEKP